MEGSIGPLGTMMTSSKTAALALRFGPFCLLALGCGSSGGGAGDAAAGSGSGSVRVGFVSEGQDVVEGGAAQVIFVALTRAVADPVQVHYFVGGSATQGDDYALDQPLSVTIPAGDLLGSIVLTPMADATCEVPETVLLTLAPAAGVDLGDFVQNTTRILDPATEFVLEVEPNDGVASANAMGALTVGRCLEIAGSIQEGAPDPFDVFEFTVPAALEVRVELHATQVPIDLLLLVTDAVGALVLPPVQSAGSGGTESVTFTVDPALLPEFNLTVLSFGELGDYRMNVVGRPIGPAPRLAAGPGRYVDWDELKRSLRSGVRDGVERAQVVGFGLVLEPESGAARAAAILAPRPR